MSAPYLDAQLTGLEQLGFPRARALDVLDLPSVWLENPRYRLSLPDALRLYETAAEETGRPHIGLEVGHGFRVASFGESGRIYAFCRDMRDVVETNARYQRIAVDVGHIRFVEENGRSYLDLAPHYHDPQTYRHITELLFGSYGTTFRWLSWGSGRELEAIHLRHAAPTDTRLHADVFECPVHFGSPHNRIEYHPDAAREPLPTADPERLALFRERLDRILDAGWPDASGKHDGDTDRRATLRAAVEAAVRGCLRAGQPTMVCVADVMGRSERRLRADLSGAGLKFRDVVDGVRMRAFDDHRARGLSLGEIADALAYNDQAALSRAFRRWHGCSPTQYMEAHPLHAATSKREG